MDKKAEQTFKNLFEVLNGLSENLNDFNNYQDSFVVVIYWNIFLNFQIIYLIFCDSDAKCG